MGRSKNWREYGADSRTPSGWLLFYHGVSDEGSVYRLGAALLDLDHPERVVARSDAPLLSPEMEYEKVGIVPKCLFFPVARW